MHNPDQSRFSVKNRKLERFDRPRRASLEMKCVVVVINTDSINVKRTEERESYAHIFKHAVLYLVQDSTWTKPTAKQKNGEGNRNSGMSHRQRGAEDHTREIIEIFQHAIVGSRSIANHAFVLHFESSPVDQIASRIFDR